MHQAAPEGKLPFRADLGCKIQSLARNIRRIGPMNYAAGGGLPALNCGR